MSEVWPATLPQYFNADGYSENLGDGRLDTPTDHGPGKSRRKYTTTWRPISGAISCTDDQVDALEDFYLDTLNGGTLDFIWKAPFSQSAALFCFRGGAPKLLYRSADEFVISIQLWQKALL